MTYRQGELIVASDFNTFRTNLLNIYDVGFGDSGYGQIDTGGAAAIPSVAIGEKIKSAEWTGFTTAGQICSTHQSSITTFPPASVLETGDLVVAHDPLDGDPYDVEESLSLISSNRLNFNIGSVTLFSNALNSIRNTAWKNQLTHRFTVTFPTVDDARYFFNSGGEIRFRASRSGGSATPQNADWTNLLDNYAPVMNYTQTIDSLGGGSIDTLIGYYDLTTSFQQLNTSTNPGAYSNNNMVVFGRSIDGNGGPNGDVGRILEFNVLYNDLSNNPFADEVDGTITSDIDYQKATAPLTIQTPVFSTSIGLSSGT